MADDGAGAAPAVAAAASASASSAVATPETTPGCTAPFFGVKHYLHRFYGLSDDECHATNVWQQIHAVRIDISQVEEILLSKWLNQLITTLLLTSSSAILFFKEKPRVFL